MEYLDILQSYKEELETGMVTNAKTGHPLSPSTVRTRIYDVTTLLGLDVTGDLSDHETARKIKALLIKSGRDQNTIAKLINTLKVVARHYHVGFNNPELKYLAKEKPVECLTRSQVDFIVSNVAKIRRDQRTRSRKETVDYMFIGLVFGARLADMVNWTKKNLSRKGDDNWLTYESQKTGTHIELPVPDSAMEVFNRQKHYLMPRTNSRLNERIRAIMAGYPELKSMAWMAHIHMFRATCATYLLGIGAPEHYVKSVTGHSMNSRAFKRYVKVHDDVKSDWKAAIAK